MNSLFPSTMGEGFTLIPPVPNGRAALLLHGFLASPYIMRGLAQAFCEEGYHVVVPQLPGHGTEFNALRVVRYEDWQDTTRTAFDTLRKTYPMEAITLLGFSLGGLLALTLALDQGLSQVITLAPAFRISPFTRLAHRLTQLKMSHWLPDLYCTQSEKINLGSYRRFPVSAVAQVQIALNVYQQTKAQTPFLPQLYCVASQDDATVSIKGIVREFQSYPTGSVLRVYDKQAAIPYGPRIQAFSHVALPVPPDDPYFGQNGQYYGALPESIQLGEPHFWQKNRLLGL